MLDAVASSASLAVLEDLRECLCFGSRAWLHVFLLHDGLPLLLEVVSMHTWNLLLFTANVLPLSMGHPPTTDYHSVA